MLWQRSRQEFLIGHGLSIIPNVTGHAWHVIASRDPDRSLFTSSTKRKARKWAEQYAREREEEQARLAGGETNG